MIGIFSLKVRFLFEIYFLFFDCCIRYLFLVVFCIVKLGNWVVKFLCFIESYCVGERKVISFTIIIEILNFFIYIIKLFRLFVFLIK